MPQPSVATLATRASFVRYTISSGLNLSGRPALMRRLAVLWEDLATVPLSYVTADQLQDGLRSGKAWAEVTSRAVAGSPVEREAVPHTTGREAAPHTEATARG